MFCIQIYGGMGQNIPWLYPLPNCELLWEIFFLEIAVKVSDLVKGESNTLKVFNKKVSGSHLGPKSVSQARSSLYKRKQKEKE